MFEQPGIGDAANDSVVNRFGQAHFDGRELFDRTDGFDLSPDLFLSLGRHDGVNGNFTVGDQPGEVRVDGVLGEAAFGGDLFGGEAARKHLAGEGDSASGLGLRLEPLGFGRAYGAKVDVDGGAGFEGSVASGCELERGQAAAHLFEVARVNQLSDKRFDLGQTERGKLAEVAGLFVKRHLFDAGAFEDLSELALADFPFEMSDGVQHDQGRAFGLSLGAARSGFGFHAGEAVVTAQRGVGGSGVAEVVEDGPAAAAVRFGVVYDDVELPAFVFAAGGHLPGDGLQCLFGERQGFDAQEAVGFVGRAADGAGGFELLERHFGFDIGQAGGVFEFFERHIFDRAAEEIVNPAQVFGGG